MALPPTRQSPRRSGNRSWIEQHYIVVQSVLLSPGSLRPLAMGRPITPPVGAVLFVGAAIGKVTIENTIKALLPSTPRCSWC